MANCHLHLGSNQEDKKVQIARAIQMIEESVGPIIASSAFYETAAWGKTAQPNFINLAIEVEHYLSPIQLLKVVNDIEDRLGRIRIEKWGPRLIDIDIIYMGDIVVDTCKLTIPHALMHKRNFVLYPMVDIAPDFVHPVLGKTTKELLNACDDTCEIKKLSIEF